MITDEKIKRINELAKKNREGTITEEEQIERKALHQEYIAAFRENLKAQLESIQYVEDLPENQTENLTAVEVDVADSTDQNDDPVYANREEFETTLRGNPSYPQGTDGEKMLERMNRSHLPLRNWAFEFLPKSNILEVGCGGGAGIAELASCYPESKIYGIDISDVSVKKSIENNQDLIDSGQVEISQERIEDLKFQDNFFDLIISIESYFFWDIDKALSEIYRVLKPGGTVLIAAETKKKSYNELTEEQRKIEDSFELTALSGKEFKALFEKYHFTDTEVLVKTGTDYICFKAEKPFN